MDRREIVAALTSLAAELDRRGAVAEMYVVGGIAAIRTADAEQIDRILGLALDGLRVAPED